MIFPFATLWIWHYKKQPGQPFRLRAGRMYAVWKGCMFLFALVDVGIISSVFMSIRDAVDSTGGIGLVVVLAGLIIHRRSKVT